jgi:hypothetical protein
MEQFGLASQLRLGFLFSLLGLVDDADCYMHLLHSIERTPDSMATLDDCHIVLLVAQGDLSLHTR